MNGTVEHMSLRDARKSSSSDQSRLSSFGGNDSRKPTYVGVVNSMDHGFGDVVDENIEALAPPDELFYQWLETRRQHEADGMHPVEAHNKALKYISYRDRYLKYLNNDGDAQQALHNIIARVERGENIVFVCYCDGAKTCHREWLTQTFKEHATE